MDIISKLTRKEFSDKTWYFPAENSEFTVSDLIRRVKTYASILASQGIRKGDSIGFINNNSSDLICLLYACWYLNAVAVPLRTNTGKHQVFEEYVERCNDICDFKLLVLDDDIYTDAFKEWALVQDKRAYSLSQLSSIQTTGHVHPVVICPDDIAIIQFSSGSTGKPKGVVVNHRMMMAQLRNLEELFTTPIGGTPVNSYALWAPVNHDMGMFVGVLSPIYQGVNNILAPPAYYMRNPERWFLMMAERKVEVAMFTNAVLAKSLPALERKAASSHIDLSRCRIYLGAEKVSPIVIREAYRVLAPLFGSKNNLYIGYGMAENALGTSTTLPGEIPVLRVNAKEDGTLEVLERDNTDGNEFASVGVPYSNNRITIRNSNDDVLPELVLGEINIESHCLTPGYFNNPEKTQEVLADQRFRTGDLGFWYLGQLYFYSRKDDLIISNGQNIVPDDIEISVEKLPFIRPDSTTLFAIESPETGLQLLHLLVEANAGISADEIKERKLEINAYIFENHGLLVNVVHLCAKGTIEKTSSGKKRRKVIRQRFINNQIEIIKREENELKAAI